MAAPEPGAAVGALRVAPQAKVSKEAPAPARQRIAEDLWAQGVAEYVDAGNKGVMGAGLRAFKASLEADPRDAKRHYFLGCITSCFHHDRDGAAVCFERAIAADPMFGMAYQELCMLYEAWGAFEEARSVARRAIDMGARWQDEWQHPPSWTPNLTANAWWDREQFSWVEELESHWEDIRDEALKLRGEVGRSKGGMPKGWAAVGTENATHDAEIVAPGGEWREFVLFGASVDSGPGSEPSRSCPRTVEIIQRLLPSAVQMAQLGVGEILFSALAPGTRLMPHCASTNVRLTCHLGLQCPKGAQIKVGPTWNKWENGRCLFFDDSFIHEISNDASSTRIVLLIRFWHPELDLDKVMPILEKGVQEFEEMNRMRLSPPMTQLAADRVNQVLGAGAGPGGATASPQARGPRAPQGPADLLRMEAEDMALGASREAKPASHVLDLC